MSRTLLSFAKRSRPYEFRVTYHPKSHHPGQETEFKRTTAYDHACHAELQHRAYRPPLSHSHDLMLTWLQRNSLVFPPLENAMREPDGLLAAGGDLSADRLIQAYRHGCFPWFQEGQPILWWSPDPRTVIFPEELHVSRSLAKVIRQGRFQVTFDQDFAAVIRACAGPRSYADGTWITGPMQTAYLELHERGHAHSVEVWENGTLVGGLYGLAMGQLFFGESMFSHADNASKVGFATLVERLSDWGFVLIDCQMPTDHLHSFGARPVPRQEFAEYLHRHLDQPNNADWPPRRVQQPDIHSN